MHKLGGNVKQGIPSEPTPGALVTVKKNGRKCVNYIECQNYKMGDPVFNLTGNVTGMHDNRSPVSNMKMYYQTKKGGGPPELNFDIDLKKQEGEDERYTLTTQPSEKDRECRLLEKLNEIENDLEDVVNKMEFIKKLRREWNYQKASLCNRTLKDKPVCYISDFEKPQ